IGPPVLRPAPAEGDALGDVCPAPAPCIHRPATAGHVVTVIVVEADGPRLILHDIVTATADDAHRDRSAPRTPDHRVIIAAVQVDSYLVRFCRQERAIVPCLR